MNLKSWNIHDYANIKDRAVFVIFRTCKRLTNNLARVPKNCAQELFMESHTAGAVMSLADLVVPAGIE